RASGAFGGRSLSQYSQFGRSSSAMCASSLADRRGGMAEPGLVIAPQHRLDLAPDARVIGVEPGKLEGEELLRIDEAAIEGNERQRLESHHVACPSRDRLGRRHQHEILQPDAVLAFEI